MASGVITNLPWRSSKASTTRRSPTPPSPPRTHRLHPDRHRRVAVPASAVNATLFGSANVAYQIGKNGGLPPAFDRKLWGRDVEGLFITAGLVIVFVLLFPLSAVAQMGSAAFLLVYSAVNIGHLRIRSKTGANPWLIVVSVVTCLALFVALSVNMIRTERTRRPRVAARDAVLPPTVARSLVGSVPPSI